MPEELNSLGYESIRAFINSTESVPDQWNWVALIDDNGNELTRIEIPTDDRATWMTSQGDQIQEVQITVNGDDPDLGTSDGSELPITIARTEWADSETGDTFGGDNLDISVTLDSVDDRRVILHRLEIPQQA